MAATELKSVEFVFYSKGIIEIFDVHTDFTAGGMLHLYRSITLHPVLPRRTLYALCSRSAWSAVLLSPAGNVNVRFLDLCGFRWSMVSTPWLLTHSKG